MGGFTGTQEDFDRTHKSVMEIKGDLDQNVKNLENAVQEVAASWKGAAAQSFTNLGTAIGQKGTDINTALQGLADLLQQAGAAYEGMDTEGQDSLSGLSGGLDGL